MFAQPQALSTCSKCGVKLDGAYTEANGALYHTNCFKCDKCHQPLGNIGIFVRAGGKTFCRPCRKSMLGFTSHNKQLPPQQQQSQNIQPIKSNNTSNNNYKSLNRYNLSKPQPLNKPRHSANNLKPIQPFISNTNSKNQKKRFSQPPSVYSTQLKNNIQSFGGIQTANELGNGYNSNANNNANSNANSNANNAFSQQQNVDWNNMNSQANNNANSNVNSTGFNNRYQMQKQQPNVNNNVNSGGFNNRIQQQQPWQQPPQGNIYSHNNFDSPSTMPSIPPSEPEPMVEPKVAQLTEDEVADWHDHSTANKPRDFLGMSQIKQRQDAAKNNTYEIKPWNENNNGNSNRNNNNMNLYNKPKKTKKKQFKLFG